jgi:hypothetical protein
MKRSLVAALILGALVSAAVIALHATACSRRSSARWRALSRRGTTPKIVSAVAHYLLVVIVALGVAYLVLTSNRPKRLGWPIGHHRDRAAGAHRVCLLYQTFFQPLPSLLALGLGFAAANGYARSWGRNRSRHGARSLRRPPRAESDR